MLPTGKAAAQVNLHAVDGRIGERIAELRNTFRYVIVHAGPIYRESGTLLISRFTDGIVLFLEANFSRRLSALWVKERLAALSVNVLGVVLNNRGFPIPEEIYKRL